MKVFRNKLRGAKSRFYRAFRPERRMVKQVEFRGSSFIVLANEAIGWNLVTHKDFERSEIECLEQVIREDDVCVDVGANIGIYSLLMAKKARKGRVISFEPIYLNRSILAVNTALNEITNVEVRECVLSDTVGETRFSVSEDAAFSSIRPTNRKKEASLLDVRSDTLDNFFAEEGQKVDVAKIDAEGAELLILRGGEKLLSTPGLRPRVALVELNAQNQAAYDYNPEEVIEFMRSFGYRDYSITESGPKEGWPREGCTEDVLFVHDE